MTRENKLALVVGFGLILLVGILVSDHFSAAQRTRPATLAAPLVDPLSRAGFEDPDLIELPAPPPRGQNTTNSVRPVSRHAEPVQRIVMGASHRTPVNGSAPTIGPPPEQASRLPFTYHTVRHGETLTSITKKHYGDTSLLEELARYNDLNDPDALRQGDRLRIPEAADLVRGRGLPSTTPATEPAATSRPPATVTYVVKSGDSLSEIASEMLGSARRWREIYEMNRDVIRDPDRVVAGTSLKITRSR